MIKHVICFKLKDEYKNCAKELVDMFLTMRQNVPMAQSVNAYADELRSARSCDVILEVVLEDFAALDAYQKDAYHAGVVKPFVHERTSSSVAADFTLK